MTAGVSPLDRLVAEAEIRQLVARYAVATDRRDLDALVALFVPDVRVRRDASGHDALRESFAEQLRSVGVTILNVGTHQIDLQGPDDASGHVYCKAEVQDGVASTSSSTGLRSGPAPWVFRPPTGPVTTMAGARCPPLIPPGRSSPDQRLRGRADGRRTYFRGGRATDR